jgi:hypothetical protein
VSTIRNKVEFEVEVGGKTLRLAARRPDQATRQQADMVWAKAWGDYSNAGVPLEVKLKDVLRRQGVWDDEKQKRLEEVDRRIAENEAKLPDAAGRVRQKGLRLADLRAAAVRMRMDRAERVMLLTEVTRLKSHTAEGLAENDRFNFLVSRCVVDAETGKKPFFSSPEDYKARGDEPASLAAAQAFANLYYDHDPDFDRKLPENAFLLKYKMCDESLALVDPRGRRVDVDGRLVDEAGEPIAEAAPEPAETFELEADEWTPPAAAPAAPEPAPEPAA